MDTVKYEYIWVQFDLGDLDTLNRYSNDGWRVVYVERTTVTRNGTHRGLLERVIP